MSAARTASLFSIAAIALLGCVSAPAEEQEAQPTEVVQPVRQPVSQSPPAEQPCPEIFSFDGQLTQGGWIRGQAPWRATAATLDGQALALDAEGRFFAAFDRDAGAQARLVATLADGRVIASPLSIAPRAWDIEHVNIARSPGGMTDAFWRIREPELARIAAARAIDSGSSGWRQKFVWPVIGRISGRFGSQRVYRGEPGGYHSGIDVTSGTSGTPYVSPAEGVVVLATQSDFSLEGKLLIIDHGNGLNSAFLHSSRLYVKEGDRVRQGQHIGDIGSSGRATGPHLHWSLKWRDARLDPLLFTGPMG